MVRRIFIALVALLIAAVGGVATFLYASGADARAMARMAPQEVLVVAEVIPAGTPSEEMVRSLAVTELPAAAVVAGGVTDLSEVAGLLTSTELQPGEQLLASRFVAPEAINEAVEVPAGMHELSIQLPTPRVIGGELRAGDTVGVFYSSSLPEETAQSEEANGTEAPGGANATHLILHKVLVTAVSGASSVTTNEDGEEVVEAPEGSLMVTVALSPADAEQLVFAAEFGSIWLSNERPDVPEDGTRLVTPVEAFE